MIHRARWSSAFPGFPEGKVKEKDARCDGCLLDAPAESASTLQKGAAAFRVLVHFQVRPFSLQSATGVKFRKAPGINVQCRCWSLTKWASASWCFHLKLYLPFSWTRATSWRFILIHSVRSWIPNDKVQRRWEGCRSQGWSCPQLHFVATTSELQFPHNSSPGLFASHQVVVIWWPSFQERGVCDCVMSLVYVLATVEQLCLQCSPILSKNCLQPQSPCLLVLSLPPICTNYFSHRRMCICAECASLLYNGRYSTGW